MLKSSILVTIRHILKKPLSVLLNVGGLSIGIVTFSILLLYLNRETSFDRYHSNANQIYRVVANSQTSEGLRSSAWTSPALIHYLDNNIPEITFGVRLFRYRSPSLLRDKTNNKNFSEEYSVWGDPEVFKVFEFDFIEGNPDNSLTRPNTMVITESAAARYFGDENPIGKILSDLTLNADFEITGVVKDMPKTTHFQADFLCSLSTLPTVWNPQIMTDWGSSFLYSYIRSDGNTSLEMLEAKLNKYIKSHLSRDDAKDIFFSLQAITDIHLKSHLQNEWKANSDIRYIYILLTVGLLILLVAIINYINLWIARSIERKKEIGIRKAIGSTKIQLLKHFAVDNSIQILLAFVLSGVIVSLALEPLRALLGFDIQIADFSHWSTLALVAVVVILFTLAVMLYPALLISKIKISEAIKGKSVRLGSGVSIWKALVAFQVLVTSMLITSALLINHQLDFVRNKPIGYDSDKIINITQPMENQQRDLLKAKLLENPLVNHASGVSHQIGGILYRSEYLLRTGDQAKQVLWQRLHTDHDFMETYGLKALAGRDFSEMVPSDTSNFLVNEAACKIMGLTPYEAVGTQVVQDNGTGKIIGVFQDFHFKTLHSEIEPLIVHIVPDRVRMLSVNIAANDFQQAITSIGEDWKEINPEVPFMYISLANYNAEVYSQEEKFSELILVFTFIVICLSVVGLISLNLYIANLKRQEIGIRKVLGATLTDVLLNLGKGFATITLASFLVSIPLSWFLLDMWLSLFAYKVSLSLLLFITAGLISFGISMTAIAIPSLRAASENLLGVLNSE